MLAVIFSWKSEKNGILLTFMPHNISQFWQNWRLLINIGFTVGCFSGIIWKKNDMREFCFGRMNDFLTKYGDESTVDFRYLMFFNKICVETREHLFFRIILRGRWWITRGLKSTSRDPDSTRIFKWFCASDRREAFPY